MSANNGVFILKTKNNYRVTYCGCVESLSPDSNGKIDPIEVVDAFKNVRTTKSFETAYQIAKAMVHNSWYVEYGIKVIEYNKYWWQIERDAKLIKKGI